MNYTKLLLIACLGCAAQAHALVDQQKINAYLSAAKNVRMDAGFLKWAEQQYDYGMQEMRYGHGRMPYEQIEWKKLGETKLQQSQEQLAQLWEGLTAEEREAVQTAAQTPPVASQRPVLPPVSVTTAVTAETPRSSWRQKDTARSVEEQWRSEETERMYNKLEEYHDIMSDSSKTHAEKKKALDELRLNGPLVFQNTLAIPEHHARFNRFIDAAKQQLASEQTLSESSAAQRIQDAWKRHVHCKLEQEANRAARLEQERADEAFARQLQAAEEAAARR